jgi:hypothetical protein
VSSWFTPAISFDVKVPGATPCTFAGMLSLLMVEHLPDAACIFKYRFRMRVSSPDMAVPNSLSSTIETPR